MAVRQHNQSRAPLPAEPCPGLSRRAVLAGAVAAPVLPRHAGLDPGSSFPVAAEGKERWVPDRVRHDEERALARWARALGAWTAAHAAIAAASHSEDEALYDRLGDRHDAALRKLLRTPAPHAVALAAKIDLLVEHVAWELTGAEPCLAALRRDGHRLAASSR